MTSKHRLIFRPMEKLQIQEMDSFKIEEADIDYSLDEVYKPGIFRVVQSFLESPEDDRLLSIGEQGDNLNSYITVLLGNMF